MVSVVRGLNLGGSAVSELAVEAGIVPPPHILEGRELDPLDRRPRAAAADQFRLVEPVDRLGESVIVTVALGPRGGFRADLDDPIRVDHGEVVRPVVGVIDEPIERAAALKAAIFSACSSSTSAFSVGATFHPTIIRENTSITNATYAKPAHVAT